jgi:hypothetical protein
VAQRNLVRSTIPTSRRPPSLKSTGAHNNKVLGLTQPKRLSWWVRSTLTYIVPPPSVFNVGLNTIISPVTHWVQLFHHNHLCDLSKMLSRPQVQLSSHNHQCDSPETFTGSPVTMWHWRCFPRFFKPLALIPLVRVAKRNPAWPLYPRAGATRP